MNAYFDSEEANRRRYVSISADVNLNQTDISGIPQEACGLCDDDSILICMQTKSCFLTSPSVSRLSRVSSLTEIFKKEASSTISPQRTLLYVRLSVRQSVKIKSAFPQPQPAPVRIQLQEHNHLLAVCISNRMQRFKICMNSV